MKAGAVGTRVLPLANTFSCGPRAAASAFRPAGLGTFQCPVDRRFSSVWAAAMVSAGVNAQCPARYLRPFDLPPALPFF